MYRLAPVSGGGENTVPCTDPTPTPDAPTPGGGENTNPAGEQDSNNQRKST